MLGRHFLLFLCVYESILLRQWWMLYNSVNKPTGFTAVSHMGISFDNINISLCL